MAALINHNSRTHITPDGANPRDPDDITKTLVYTEVIRKRVKIADATSLQIDNLSNKATFFKATSNSNFSLRIDAGDDLKNIRLISWMAPAGESVFDAGKSYFIRNDTGGEITVDLIVGEG